MDKISLLEQIKTDSIKARIAKDTVAASLLVTLLAEATKVGKDKGNRESTDDEVMSVVKKFLKNAEETQSHFNKKFTKESADQYSKRIHDLVSSNAPYEEISKAITDNGLTEKENQQVSVLSKEITILKDYLASQLTREELEAIIKGCGTKNMGEIMKYLKANYAGLYDGKLASEIAKGL